MAYARRSKLSNRTGSSWRLSPAVYIDVFLQEKIPDYAELFDYVFINKFQFDQQGLFTGIATTKYDFEGKFMELKKSANGKASALVTWSSSAMASTTSTSSAR
jgi:hypothetical protein